jgi:hypothetical protein
MVTAFAILNLLSSHYPTAYAVINIIRLLNGDTWLCLEDFVKSILKQVSFGISSSTYQAAIVGRWVEQRKEQEYTKLILRHLHSWCTQPPALLHALCIIDYPCMMPGHHPLLLPPLACQLGGEGHEGTRGAEVRRQPLWKVEWGVGEGEDKVGERWGAGRRLRTPTQHRRSPVPQEQRSPERPLWWHAMVGGHRAAACSCLYGNVAIGERELDEDSTLRQT